MAAAKPKINRKGSEKEVSNYDQCLTPPYALEPLWPYLDHTRTIWESAYGKGHLYYEFYSRGYSVIGTDLALNDRHNFLKWEPSEEIRSWDTQITNPPYSIKFAWLKRSYELGKPFALLLPVEVIGANKYQQMMKKYGCELMLLDSRVDFHMPDAGWGGAGSQFPVMWVCWQLLPEKMMYGSIKEAKKKWKEQHKAIIEVDRQRVAEEKLRKELEKQALMENAI